MTDHPAFKRCYSRRGFVGLCGAAATAAALGRGQAPRDTFHAFARVSLVDGWDRPVKAADLVPRQDYVFYYPYACTPCFLLDVGEPAPPEESLYTADGQGYRWRGGVGSGRSVVAFAAICSHRLTYPTPEVSFIGYRSEAVPVPVGEDQVVKKAGVIQCCSEHSIYDPVHGAQVLAGPAPQPLAAIQLEEQGGGLIATGVYGGTLYEDFLDRFAFRLAMDFGDYRRPVTGQTRVWSMTEFTRHRVRC